MKLKGRVIKTFDKMVYIEVLKPHSLKDNQPVKIEFQPDNANQQLRGLLWELISFLAREIGYTPDQMYGVMKDVLRMYEIVYLPNGEMVKVYQSTANGEIDDKQLSEVYNNLERWAIDEGYNIEPFIQQHLMIRELSGK